MNKNQVLAGGFLLAVMLAGGIWLWTKHSTVNPATAAVFVPPVPPKNEPPMREVPSQVVDQVQEALAQRENQLQHPGQPGKVRFYGKVTDEKGAALAGARIMVSPVVKNEAKGPILTDPKGRFSLEGIGPASSVFVSKAGYRTFIVMNGQFHYALGAQNPSYTKPETPALFTLAPQ